MNLAWILLTNALILGFRHGLDWDHIAAVMDIVGTVTTDGHCAADGALAVQKRTVALSSLYALGHALVVVVLGLGTLTFAAMLPAWVSPIMERLVGATLLVFGACVIYVSCRFLVGKSEVKMTSRWVILFGALSRFSSWVRRRFFKHQSSSAPVVQRYGPGTALSVGMLHGVGAETGTQVLIMASVGGQADHVLALAMLGSFVAGFAISNTVVAFIGASGLIYSVGIKWLYGTTAVLTGVFSLVVGAFFTMGLSESLPDLEHLFHAGGL